jgi:hypothetical protein
MPRSLASVHGAAIARFLERNVVTRPTTRRELCSSREYALRDLALSADGSTFVRANKEDWMSERIEVRNAASGTLVSACGFWMSERIEVRNAASGTLVSACGFRGSIRVSQLATCAGGVLYANRGSISYEVGLVSLMPPAPVLYSPTIAIAFPVKGMYVVGALLAVCGEWDEHITVFNLEDITWSRSRSIWKIAHPCRFIQCRFPRRLCALYYNNVPCVAATQPRCVSIFCVSSSATLRCVGQGVLRDPLSIVFRASSNQLIVADVIRGVVVLSLGDPGGHYVIPNTRNATSIALHRDTLLVAWRTRVVALTLD